MIRICYDNTSVKRGIKSAWGFAALVTYGGKNLLFDTGGKPDVLLSNLKAMKIAPASVTDILISHNHWDHTGGLFNFLNENHNVRVFLPISFSETYRKEVQASGAECYRINGFAEIAKDIYSTGPLGNAIIEQALIIDTPKGPVVLTGCAHPGIVEIVKSAERSLGKPVFAVLGGFHLADKSDAEIKKIVSEFKKMGVTHIAPCHCTGEKAIRKFKAAYGERFMPVGAGSTVDI